MIPIADAQSRIWATCERLEVTTVEHTRGVGRVLARDVIATENVPPFDNSAVDGYAVRAADVATVPVELVVIDTVAAGAVSSRALKAGEAIRIMTGAPIPAGADAVVMVEDSERVGDERVRLTKVADLHGAIRRSGSDVRAGETVFPVGTVLNAAAIGVLASINAQTVEVFRPARVALLSTGDELIVDGSPLGPGQIRESNLTMLDELIRATGCDVINLGVVRDDEAELERVLREVSVRCDAIVTSGGVSMGDFDVVKAVLSRIADMQWMQLAIKPAKPFAFGRLQSGDGRTVPIFGLPGNPVSSMISYELIARPALLSMMGHERTERRRIAAIAEAPLRRKRDGKVHFMRVFATFADDGRLHVRESGPQGSHQLAATAMANAIAVVPDGDGVPVGATVEVFLLD